MSVHIFKDTVVKVKWIELESRHLERRNKQSVQSRSLSTPDFKKLGVWAF